MDDHHFSYIRKLAKKREKKTLNLWFWNIEISCSQWEGSACTQSALIFFLLSFGGGGGKGPLGREDFFIFPLFSTCSQWVPIRFPIGSQCVVPQGCSQQHLHPYVLPKVLPFSPIQVGQKGRNSLLQNRRVLFWGSSIVSSFFLE